jgi:hypothetical protein
MPQIEPLTRITMRILKGRYPNGVNRERKTGGNEKRAVPLALCYAEDVLPNPLLF